MLVGEAVGDVLGVTVGEGRRAVFVAVGATACDETGLAVGAAAAPVGIPVAVRVAVGDPVGANSAADDTEAVVEGFPWHDVVPESVKVFPASGTNFQL